MKFHSSFTRFYTRFNTHFLPGGVIFEEGNQYFQRPRDCSPHDFYRSERESLTTIKRENASSHSRFIEFIIYFQRKGTKETRDSRILLIYTCVRVCVCATSTCLCDLQSLSSFFLLLQANSFSSRTTKSDSIRSDPILDISCINFVYAQTHVRCVKYLIKVVSMISTCTFKRHIRQAGKEHLRLKVANIFVVRNNSYRYATPFQDTFHARA